MNRTDTLDATLRRLDAADRTVDPASDRARAALDAILATDPSSTPPRSLEPQLSPRARPRRTGFTVRRLALLGGAATAAAALVVVPALTGGDPAFATWTATPAGLSAQQSEEAAASCREHQEDAGPEYADDLAHADVAVADIRGEWTTVVLAGPDGFSALCITDDSAHLFTNSWIGSVGGSPDGAAPGPREVRATDLGVGTVDSHQLSLIAGEVGPDVTGVDYDSPEHGTVSGTVSTGRFALWFPGDELWSAATDGVDVTVTYDDGTTAIVSLAL